MILTRRFEMNYIPSEHSSFTKIYSAITGAARPPAVFGRVSMVVAEGF